MRAMRIESFIEQCIRRYQLQEWWPGSSFEIALSAVLVQNTNWNGAWRALLELKERGLTTNPRLIATLSTEELAELIRPAGFYKRKASTINNLAKLWIKSKGKPTREELLKIKGIGEETADSICLYACGYPTIPIDAYTKRIWGRIPLQPGEPKKSEELRRVLLEVAKNDVRKLKMIHAAFVEFGKEYCAKTPRCAHCFLKMRCKTGREHLEGQKNDR